MVWCQHPHQGWFQTPTDSEGGRKPTRWVPGTSARTDVAGTGWGAARWKGGRALFSQGPVPPPSHTWRLQASALFCPFTPKNSWLRQSWWRSWVHCTQTTHTHTHSTFPPYRKDTDESGCGEKTPRRDGLEDTQQRRGASAADVWTRCWLGQGLARHRKGKRGWGRRNQVGIKWKKVSVDFSQGLLTLIYSI